MPSALVTSAVLGVESIDQPTTRRDQTSSTTAQYTLPSLVGCSVMSVTPELIRFVSMKPALDSIAGSGHAGDPPKPRPAGDSLDSSTSHQPLDRLMADGDAAAEDQIRMDATDPIGTSGRDVHLTDHLGEPGVSDAAS
jgi:hypothetical protein